MYFWGKSLASAIFHVTSDPVGLLTSFFPYLLKGLNKSKEKQLFFFVFVFFSNMLSSVKDQVKEQMLLTSNIG